MNDRLNFPILSWPRLCNFIKTNPSVANLSIVEIAKKIIISQNIQRTYDGVIYDAHSFDFKVRNICMQVNKSVLDGELSC